MAVTALVPTPTCPSDHSPLLAAAPFAAPFFTAQLSPRKHVHAPTPAPFFARRYAGLTRSLIDTLTWQHPRASLVFSSHRRTASHYLPGRTAFTRKTRSRADPCALFRPPLRQAHSLSYRHAHLATPTRRLTFSLRTVAPITTTFPDAQLSPAKHARAPIPARFSAHRCAGLTRSLIDTLTWQHPRADSRFLFAPPHRFPLPSRAQSFHPENTLARRPLHPFPPAAAPVVTPLSPLSCRIEKK